MTQGRWEMNTSLGCARCAAVAVVIALCTGTLCPGAPSPSTTGADRAATAGPPAAKDLVNMRALEPLGRNALPLDTHTFQTALGVDHTSTRITVALWETWYRCRAVVTQNGHTREWRSDLFCYELVSDAPYSWTVCCSGMPVGCFRLIVSKEGTPYLAWSAAGAAWFADISVPRDRCVAIQEHLLTGSPGPPGAIRVPFDACPEAAHWGANAFYPDVTMRSIDRLPEGGWRVVISPPDDSKRITLVCKNGKWSKQ